MAGLSGSAVSAAANSVTPPVGNVGDLMVVFAYRTGSNTAPGLPGGWTALDNTGGSSNAFRAGYKIATSTTDSSGTWTNATDIVLFRVSGQIADPGWIGGAAKNTGSGTTVTYGAVTLSGSGSNWIVSFCGAASATALGTRTGYSRDTAVGSAPMSVGEHLRNPAGTLQTVTATGSGTWITFQQEILAVGVTAAATPTVTSTVTATAGNSKPVTASRTTTSTITPSATSSKPVTASRSTTATTTPTATTAKPVTATPSVTATVTPTATSAKPIAASRSTTATVIPAATLTKTATATRATVSTVTPTGTLAKPVTSSVTTTSTITAAATVTPGGVAVDIAATPTVTSTVTSAATLAKPVSAAVTSTSTISPSAALAKPVTASPSTTSTITPTVTSAKPVAVSAIRTVTTTPGATVAKTVTASVATADTFTAAAEVGKPVTATVTRTSTRTTAGSVAKPVVATRTTAATVTATTVAAVPAAAAATRTATVTADVDILHPALPVEFTVGVPGTRWYPADPTSAWAPSTPTTRWAVGEPMTQQFAALAVQLVTVPVQGKAAGQPINPTTDTVYLAFMDGRAEPTSPDWVTGSWDTTATIGVYLAQALIGPGTDAVLTPGTYSVWVKIVDDPETPVFQVGAITVY